MTIRFLTVHFLLMTSTFIALTLPLRAIAPSQAVDKRTSRKISSDQFVIKIDRNNNRRNLDRSSLEKIVKKYTKYGFSVKKIFDKPLQHVRNNEYFVVKVSLGENQKKNPNYILALMQHLEKKEKLSCEPDYIFEIMQTDTYFPPSSGAWTQSFEDLWGLSKIDAQQAWGTSTGSGVVVAVLDTGVDSNHPDIQGNVLNGFDFVNNDADAFDDNGHGTHVAGTIAALFNNGIGIAGVAHGAKILPLKVLASSGGGTSVGIAQAINYATNNGADIINMSLGSNNTPWDLASQFFKDALANAHAAGITIVVSAGNLTTDVINTFPANDPYVINVSAFDSTDTIASFSNFGNIISVAAPGGGDQLPSGIFESQRSVLSLLSSGATSGTTGNGQLIVGTNYLRQGGTSMASPHVSGVAALVIAANPTYTPEQVRQAIQFGSDDVSTPGFDIQSGFGRINANGALTVNNPATAHINDPNSRLKVPFAGIVPISGSILGSVSVWQLDYQPLSGGSWTQIATGTNQVSDAVIANWNTTGVTEGDLILRLIVEDTSGRKFQHRRQINLDILYISDPITDSFHNDNTLAIHGAANDPGFINFTVEAIDRKTQLAASTQPVEVGGGGSPITNGKLADWDISSLAPSHYEIKLTTNSSSGSRVDTVNIVIDDRIRDGWPVKFPGQTSLINKPLVSDVAGDSKKEVIFISGGFIYVYSEDGTLLSGWPQPVDVSSTYFFETFPAVADIDNDGAKEIIVPGRIIQVLNGDGTEKFAMGPALEARYVSAEDLDGDGFLEILTLTDLANGDQEIRVFGHVGNLLPGWPVQLEQSVGSYPAIGDINGDGEREIAYVTHDQNHDHIVHLLNRDGSPVSGWPATIVPPPNKCGIGSNVTIANLDNDHSAEVVYGGCRRHVYAFNSDGSLRSGFPANTPNSLVPAYRGIAIGDVTNDGNLEIITATTSSFWIGFNAIKYLDIYSDSGTTINGSSIFYFYHALHDPVLNSGVPVIADINNDGINDIVHSAGSTDPNFTYKVDSWDGSQLAPSGDLPTIAAGHVIRQGPTITDLDNDNLLEMVGFDAQFGPLDGSGSEFNVYVWDLPTSAASPQPWPGYLNDAKNTSRHSEANFFHRIFVSSTRQDGNLGGLSGADATCQSLADGANLTGQWKALLSDSSTNAKDRLLIVGPVFNLNDQKIADNANDLWDGQLDNAVRYDQNVVEVSATKVWTGTFADGTSSTTFTCTNWTSNSGSVKGRYGRSNHVGNGWMEDDKDPCDEIRRLFCIDADLAP